MTITIDSREAAAHPVLVNELRRLKIPVEIKMQDFGDYSFTGARFEDGRGIPVIGIEVSTVADVVGKIASGRLTFQVSHMLEKYDVTILLISSPISATKDGYVWLPGGAQAMQFDRMMNVLQAAQSHGLILTFAQNSEAVPARIAELYNYWRKPHTEHKLFRPRAVLREAIIPIGEAIDDRITTLMTWPGIGEDRARAILLHHGSILNATVAGEKGLKEVPGIGPMVAKKVWDFLRKSVV